MDELDAETRRLARVIDHPIRLRIVALLGERGPLGWKELSTELGVKTGALYHHLDTLEGLVERDSSKKYVLTRSGRIVYSKISEGQTIDAVHRAALEIRREGTVGRTLLSIFIPRSLLGSLTSSRKASLVLLVLVGALSLGFCGLTGVSPELYFVHHDPGIVQIIGGYSVSLGTAFAVSYLAAVGVFKANVDAISLVALSSVSFLPAFAASAITLYPAAGAFLTSSSGFYTLFIVLFQVWSSALLGAGLSVATGVRIERTTIVGLFPLYATMVLMLLHGATI